MPADAIIPSPWSILPFAVLLAAMALGPVVARSWWTRHYPKVALALGTMTCAYYLLVLHAPAKVGHAAHEYVSFVALVGGLFVVSGGIHIRPRGQGSPLFNIMFLFTGAVLANILGTTGAAVLLIRPWIRLNRTRIRPYHIVFFIFIVANAGGCLTPIGDPPLFLGYLQGVPFWWVLQTCWPMWATGVTLLLGIFYVLDVRYRPVEEIRRAGEPESGGWKIEGRINLIFLVVILAAVFIQQPVLLREGLMIAAAAGSYFATPKSVHESNGFNFHPLSEVAILFAGIFATMIPAMDWLGGHAADVLGQRPGAGVFYWGAGVLSSVLDNAPTYLAFFSSLSGIAGLPDTAALLQQHSASLAAISVGAVFFGAATYIGNGPNFMVKAIAEQDKIPMPSFAEFVLKYTLPWLAPVLLLVWLLYF